jgi:hypothetical protein
VVEQRRDLGLRLGVIARHEERAPAARLLWVGAEHGGCQRVGRLDDARRRDEIGDDLTRGPGGRADSAAPSQP